MQTADAQADLSLRWALSHFVGVVMSAQMSQLSALTRSWNGIFIEMSHMCPLLLLEYLFSFFLSTQIHPLSRITDRCTLYPQTASIFNTSKTRWIFYLLIYRRASPKSPSRKIKLLFWILIFVFCRPSTFLG